ncbi:ankyrin repeat-containing protein, putative [Talaromyces stipitatus ATCC 10500]|uniref:Ankyrin repeat-containing protein, putative n=1 Tax=Talaromyces stipitatus (strain ATCC 10500 / CBS 375.48 / QM 6759 / NRRL 1006) TaxID=441959 RepID=B8MTB9_TALSN|nr:ankyrin repeat-containing protein, putative [Talaromyces stipitatus ATCC 10500]EED12369.1 ankyrin repeat-containing protein, putative [Talaromyces stipitatus ATCC 10500]
MTTGRVRMALSYYISIFFCLACCVSADNWDDFANNLATDLAPLITLFGEQITRQCMSELISTLDDFIFALAPLGVLTAVVSAIRVCGNPTLRAIIGRAQEDPASSEKEILSCVSDSTAEIFTESGVARITGNPKILEIVADESKVQSGIVTIRKVSEVAGKDWTDLEKDVKLPNLSLNKGIRRRAPIWFHLAAIFGVVLQLSVIIYAALTVFYWPQSFLKNGGRVDSYAFPMFVLGTALLTQGMFLCAVLVERHSEKHIFTLPEESRVYWIQPGNQTVGDQKFPSFVGRTDKGVYFIRSVRHQPLNEVLNVGREMQLIFVVCLTMVGFVIQFVGIRGLHSSVILAQLGATMVMTLVRTGLRAERMREGDNMLKVDQDIVSSGEHELDWIVFRLFNIKSFRLCPTNSLHAQNTQTQSSHTIHELVSTREKLRKLAGSDWDETSVRTLVRNLDRAAQELATLISSWSEKEISAFDIVIPLAIQKEDQQTVVRTWEIRLSTGKSTDIDSWEAILGLYVWSLKQVNRGLKKKSQNSFFRAFRPKGITPHQARLLHRTWTADRSIFDKDRSATRCLLNDSETIGHFDLKTSNQVIQDTPVMAVTANIYTLAAQDIYMHLLFSMLRLLPSIGGHTHITGSDKSSYRVCNDRVEALANVFANSGLGNNTEGMICNLQVLSDSSLISGVSSGLPDIRQSMEVFASQGYHNGLTHLITMSEWLCSLTGYEEVQPCVVEYAHICLKVLLEQDVTAKELAAQRIKAIVDVNLNDRASFPVSKYLDLESVPSDAWCTKYRTEISWMVTHMIHYLTKRYPGQRTMTILQDLKGTIGIESPIPEIYDDLQAAQSSRQTFFDIWLGSDVGFSIEDDQSSQMALDWLVQNQFDILQELLIIKLVNDLAEMYRLLAVIVYAIRKGYTQTMRLVLHHAERSKRKEDIIIELARQGNTVAFEAIFEKECSRKVTGAYETAFLIAAQMGHHSLLKFLLESGANVNFPDSNGKTALMEAATNRDVASTEILLSHNANIDQKDKFGDTALIIATERGFLPIVELLVNKGADINVIGSRGRTPLMAATVRQELPLVKYLCAARADLNINDHDQYSVLDIAARVGLHGPWMEGHAYLSAVGAKYSRGP